MKNLLVLHPFFIVPILNLAVFSFLAQYVVPELVQGLDPAKPQEKARAIVLGMVNMSSLLQFPAVFVFQAPSDGASR